MFCLQFEHFVYNLNVSWTQHSNVNDVFGLLDTVYQAVQY